MVLCQWKDDIDVMIMVPYADNLPLAGIKLGCSQLDEI